MEPGNDPSADPQPNDRRRLIVRLVLFAGWGLVIAIQIAAAVANPTIGSIIVATALTLLFVLVNLNLYLVRWVGHRNWRRVAGRLHGSAYLSDFHNLPNRNYVLSELRREMPRSRTSNSPFVIIQVSLDTLPAIRQRRGPEFADRSVNSLVEVLKRLTRSSDFLAHLGAASFCVMLVECTLEQSYVYLKRVPGTISVSDGHTMLDVAVTARVLEYDLEALYATDVLRDVEEMPPLRRREQVRANAMAA